MLVSKQVSFRWEQLLPFVVIISSYLLRSHALGEASTQVQLHAAMGFLLTPHHPPDGTSADCLETLRVLHHLLVHVLACRSGWHTPLS